MKIVGFVNTNVKSLLNLTDVDDHHIYLGSSNIEHMASSHPGDFAKYGKDIENILRSPDYIGQNKKDGSIEYVKEYLENNEFVKVAVRVSSANKFYARSLYVLNNRRVHNFIIKGTLIAIDTENE